MDQREPAREGRLSHFLGGLGGEEEVEQQPRIAFRPRRGLRSRFSERERASGPSTDQTSVAHQLLVDARRSGP